VRAVRLALAGLLGLASAVIGAPAAFAAGASLTLDPTHGGTRTTITITYRHATGANGLCPVARSRVVFGWDGNAVTQTQLNRDTCSVRVRLRPPRARNDPGPHRVTAVIPAVLGSQASAVYTIDGGTPSPTARQTTAPANPATALPVDTSPVVDSPVPDPAVAGTAATAAAADPQPAWVTWALVFGGLLVVGGAGTLGMVIVRSRRERSPY
jgi:hypothetical protein